MSEYAWPFVALVATALAFVGVMKIYAGWAAEMARRRVASIDVEAVRTELRDLSKRFDAMSKDFEQLGVSHALRTLSKK